jgi:glycosyltransferase involved in cell wall biosynthesis
MKVFCHIPRENWFADRFGFEYRQNSSHDVSFVDLDCDVLWLLAAWCWKQIPIDVLKNKKVVCTIHHEVPDKFDKNKENDFRLRDEIVDIYHVPCRQTKKFISKFTDKPIMELGYWCNTNIWYRRDKRVSRNNLKLPKNKFFVGSFQRDTEGNDLISPKLEKGPDRFCDYVEKLNNERGNVHVLLNGWRRQYVISRLESSNISYTYHELPSLRMVAEMYSACDLYIVASRFEGGPQSVLEAPAMNVPIISTDVGMASKILPKSCIINMKNNYNLYLPNESDINYAFKKVENYFINNHLKRYDNFFEGLE